MPNFDPNLRDIDQGHLKMFITRMSEFSPDFDKIAKFFACSNERS